MVNLLKRFLSEESGQAMVEYGLIIALIAVVVVGVIATLGGKIKDAFQSLVTQLTPAP